MATVHGLIFREIDMFWHNVRYFFRNNKTLFDIFFLLLYTFEQLLLFFLILVYPSFAALISGLFAIIVISTISFEKICMESRYTWLKEKLQEQEIEKEMLMKEYIIRIKNFERIQEKLTKFK